MQRWWQAMRAPWRRRDLDRELRDELNFHLAMRAQRLQAEGMTPEAARQAARRRLGNELAWRERCRDVWVWRWAEDLSRDVAVGLRGLRRAPGFAAAAVVVFALAIGANTAVFSLANAIYYHPLPSVRGFSRMVEVVQIRRRGGWTAETPWSEYRYLRRRAQGLSVLSATRYGHALWTGGAAGPAPRRILAVQVTANHLAEFALRPVRGRMFRRRDEAPGRVATAPVAMLDYTMWRQVYGGGAVVGRKLMLNGVAHRIIGVLPFDALPMHAPAVWLPLPWRDGAVAGAAPVQVWGRLAPGESVAAASVELAGLARRWPAGHPREEQAITAAAWPLRKVINGTLTARVMTPLLAIMAFLLLLACANVAHLQLARSLARRPELAMRAALGAGRGRLLRQMLAESLVLAAGGAAAGIALAALAIPALRAAMPAKIANQIAGWSHLSLDWRALAYALAAALAAGILAGLAPALRAPRAAAPRARVAGAGLERKRLQAALAVAQVALALVLLSGTGVMAGSFLQYATKTRRFRPKGVMTLRVSLPAARYATPGLRAAFYRRALARLAALPGAKLAGLFVTPPDSNDGTRWREYRGQAAPVRVARTAVVQTVSDDYFRLLHLALLRGRTFTAADGAQAAPVAIVSRRLARRDWPGEVPIGKHLWMGKGAARIAAKAERGATAITVVGVAPDVEYAWTDPAGRPEAVIYRPWTQAPPAAAILAVRRRGAAAPDAAAMRAVVAHLDPNLPLRAARSLAVVIYDQLAAVYLIGDISLAMGFIALALAVAGIHGVTAYGVNLRRREIGIRLALGARRRGIPWWFVRRALPLIAIGLALGAAGAIWNARLIASLFYSGGAADPLLAVAVLLAASAMAASYWPARRAARLDPAATLRQE